MNIGINWFTMYSDPEQNADLYAKNGIFHTFMMSGRSNNPAILAALKRNGIVLDNFHSPFDGINEMWIPGDAGDTMLRRLLAAVDECAANDVRILVVHLSSGNTPPLVNDLGFERYSRLMEYAKSAGVTIAFENIRKLANVAFAMEAFPEAKFCWDCGHEGCYTPNIRFMPLFGDRLVALHLHDNSTEKDADQHLLPYDGKIDFDSVARQIADNGYSGTVMLETNQFSDVRPNYNSLSPEEFFSRAVAAVTRLRSDIESKRRGDLFDY